MSDIKYNSVYQEARNSHIAFPLGGIGAGMLCLEGTGALSHVSLRNTPDVFAEPMMFSAVCVKGEAGNVAKVLEGPVPNWKITRSGGSFEAGNGLFGKHYGLPRFSQSEFQSRFPFGLVQLNDQKIPLEVTVTGWSPFIPLNGGDSSLPMAGLEFTFLNTADHQIELVYSFHAANFMSIGQNSGASVLSIENGFVLNQPPTADKPWEQGASSIIPGLK